MSTLADVDDIGVLKHFFHRFAVNLHDIPHPLVAGNVVEDSPVFVVVRILIACLVDSNFGLLLFETENGSRAILGMDAIKITIFDIVEDYIKMTFLHINLKDFFIGQQSFIKKKVQLRPFPSSFLRFLEPLRDRQGRCAEKAHLPESRVRMDQMQLGRWRHRRGWAHSCSGNAGRSIGFRSLRSASGQRRRSDKRSRPADRRRFPQCNRKRRI